MDKTPLKIFVLVAMSFFVISCVSNKLVYFANNSEIIAETKNTVPTLSSRVIKLKEFGECDGTHCPKEKL